jgi:hypothetical protein
LIGIVTIPKEIAPLLPPSSARVSARASASASAQVVSAQVEARQQVGHLLRRVPQQLLAVAGFHRERRVVVTILRCAPDSQRFRDHVLGVDGVDVDRRDRRPRHRRGE